ncbi:hypothetical protein WMY93_014815 [Mugilogobius chulae]|uniref:Ig-like domain-containing protein n=1 Tax=Mugilogobius chulae TaxID=88201 RepID=A0AAW0P017_9GOBI
MRLHTITALLLVFCVGAPSSRATKVYEVKEGEDLRLKCSFYSTGFEAIFCRNNCGTREDFLGSTLIGKQSQNRFTVEFEKQSSYPNLMYVTIRNVQLSDAGSYKCGLLNSDDFKWKLVDVIIYVTSGSAAGVSSLEGPRASEVQQDDTTPSDVWLYVGLTLSALLILSVIFTTLHWRKRHRTNTEPAQGPGNAQILKSSHEEADSKQSRAADGELSSVCFSNPTHTDSH